MHRELSKKSARIPLSIDVLFGGGGLILRSFYFHYIFPLRNLLRPARKGLLSAGALKSDKSRVGGVCIFASPKNVFHREHGLRLFGSFVLVLG